MNILVASILLGSVSAVLLLPRRAAMVALIVGGCCLPVAMSLELGPFNFYPLRLLLAAALLRIMLWADTPPGGMNGLDWAMVAWVLLALASCLFYDEIADTLTNRLGLVFTAAGSYAAFRMFCHSHDDRLYLCRVLAWLMVPLALAMSYERLSGHNLFLALGGLNDVPEVRNGAVRAQGPFAHSILAGSAGAMSLPLVWVLWRTNRHLTIAATMAAFTMILASGSTGPILSALCAAVALALWHVRDHVRTLCWAALLAYISLDLVMQAPAYYLMARIDLTGSSTSWHRAALIEAAIDHLPQWWLAGTDYTRHWIAYGVPWSPNHIDVTNHYLRLGVDGGLPLMLSFIVVLAIAFSYVGRAVRQVPANATATNTNTNTNANTATTSSHLVIWALGAALFGHVVTFLSVSYFDQSVIFLYATLAAIASTTSRRDVPAHTRLALRRVSIPGAVLRH
ncbi:MAG: hypothetical protein IPG93_25910 [Burkholderiales bacterium]|nr:hypothetical protein [Burkholderiales bacterium]